MVYEIVARSIIFILRSIAIILILIGSSIAAGPVDADPVRFNIDEQPLANALREFARQSDREILFSIDVVGNKDAQLVAGVYEPEDALELLLADTELFYSVTGSDIFLVTSNEIQVPGQSQPGSRGSSNRAGNTSNEIGLRRGQTDPEGIEEIIVTGSRIPRTGFDTPTPTSFVTSEEIAASGFVNIDDTLLRNPTFGVGLGSANGTRNENAGAAFVNLRGLGTNRSLVVVDGKRRVSGSRSASAVDLNSIPAALVERVEVTTGGASAVYGADAVSGVVNVITKSDFEGLELSTSGGVAGHGGAGTYSISVFGGSNFADGLGNISVAVTYNEADSLSSQEREFSRYFVSSRSNSNNTGPNDGIPDRITYRNVRINTYLYGGSFVVNGDVYTYDDGGLRIIDTGIPISSIVSIGGEGRNINDDNQLRVPQEMLSFRGDIDFSLSSNLDFFSTFDVVQTDTEDFNRYIVDDGRSLFRTDLTLQRDNAFLPAEMAALMDANGLTSIAFRQTPINYGFVGSTHDRNMMSSVTGLSGSFSEYLSWEAFFQYGQFTDSIQTRNARIEQNYINAVDAVVDPISGEIVCRSLFAQADGCVPVNVIGGFSPTEEQRAYISHTRLQYVENTQRILGLQGFGDLMDLPAGPLQYAIGAEYREEHLKTEEDGLALAGELVLSITPNAPVDAEFDVTEVFGELRVPLIQGKRFAESFELEVAARLSDYSTIGSTFAWNAGVSWEPTNDLRVRATHTKSVRAPNLFELFEAQINLIDSFKDPCFLVNLSEGENRPANCAALGVPPDLAPKGSFVDAIVATVLGGNPDLQEETSTSTTIGLVFQPGFAPNWSASVDYYNIEIEGAVGSFDAETVVNRCVDADTIQNVFCGFVVRDSDGQLEKVSANSFNIGELRAEGIDFAATYETDAFNIGVISINLFGNYQIEHEELVDPFDPASLVINDGEVDNPTLRFNLTASLQRNNWKVDLVNRFIDRSKIDVQASPERFDIDEVASQIYTDLRFGIQLSDRYHIGVSVNNVFDREPPYSAVTYEGKGRGSLYDNIGRLFHLQLEATFE